MAVAADRVWFSPSGPVGVNYTIQARFNLSGQLASICFLSTSLPAWYFWDNQATNRQRFIVCKRIERMLGR